MFVFGVRWGRKPHETKPYCPPRGRMLSFFFPFVCSFLFRWQTDTRSKQTFIPIFAFIGPFFCLVLFLTGGLIDSLMLRKTPIQACAFLSSRFGDAPLNLRGSTEQNDILETHF